MSDDRSDIRPLPSVAILRLAAATMEPGFMEFVADIAEEGFVLVHPSDWELSDDKWEEIADLRVATMLRAWRSLRSIS